MRGRNGQRRSDWQHQWGALPGAPDGSGHCATPVLAHRSAGACLKSRHALGLSQIQLNVVSTATLRDAQGHAERHRDLIIRVAGYSARFTELSRDVQDAIILRMEQRMN